MNILVLGSGGREHAIAWKLASSPKVEKLYVAPGNAGTREIAENVAIKADDFDAVADFVCKAKIDMVVVGPEDPLVKGIVDYFAAKPEFKNLMVIGPDKVSAQLEGSKEFAKMFMQKYGIPTAKYLSVTAENISEGEKFLESVESPYVLKADGLAAGKGVLIINDLDEAKSELRNMLGGKFGNAGHKVVLEQYLDGIECSVFAITDGCSYVLLPEAKDYKRIGEGNTGLNTGGMGSVSPVPFYDKDFAKKVEERIVKPTIDGIHSEGMDYRGFVFFGLMNVNGNPYVIEYNVRMGDPETESVMLRIKSDLVELLEAAAKRKLAGMSVEFDSRAASTVMMVSGGYPEAYEKGKVISGLEKVKSSVCFHAGTALSGNDVVTSGGRVIAVSSYGDNIFDALKVSYESIRNISFEKCYFRTDLGFDLK
ncbi:MAG: phosphoribosylamine--glycine ligase [Bacteroidales bacterium]|nr:phosphoribosylamine--glycine ligase [Bacteroidales bacterium]